MVETRVLIADGQQMVREGIRLILEAQPGIEVIGDEGRGDVALQRIEQERPDVAILEVTLARMSGLCVIERLSAASATRCVILSTQESRALVQEALRAGAAGYVLKSAPAAQLLEAIEVVGRGQYYLSPDIAGHVVEAARNPDRARPSDLGILTSREREVLQLIAEGLSTKEIAVSLGISSRTTDSHRARVMDKLAIHKVSGLVRFAIREGLVEL